VVAGTPTVEGEGLADTGAANPFALPRRHPGIRFAVLAGYSMTWSARCSSD